jgi:molybdopterin-guanine dinucleotide biosynthesis protein B
MLVLGFYGYSDSGKTYLVTQILRELRQRGTGAAAVKISSKPTIDSEGKDTMAYLEAGAEVVVANCTESTVFITPSHTELAAILQHLEAHEPEVVLVEGLRDSRFPKVAVGDVEQLENVIYRYGRSAEKDGIQFILDYIKRRLENE